MAQKAFVFVKFLYGYQGRMIISKAIVVDSTAVIITDLVHTFVYKGCEKYVLSFLNLGLVVKGVYVYQVIWLRDGFSPH